MLNTETFRFTVSNSHMLRWSTMQTDALRVSWSRSGPDSGHSTFTKVLEIGCAGRGLSMSPPRPPALPNPRERARGWSFHTDQQGWSWEGSLHEPPQGPCPPRFSEDCRKVRNTGRICSRFLSAGHSQPRAGRPQVAPFPSQSNYM